MVSLRYAPLPNDLTRGAITVAKGELELLYNIIGNLVVAD